MRVENSTDYKHVKWLELKPGMMTECAIMKEDEYGNFYFFEIAKLDSIDKQRLFKLITNRHAGNFPLWDLMSQHTLGNGMNSLNYFHQLVKIVTPDGVITDPRAGRIGLGTQKIDTAPVAEAPVVQAPAADPTDI